MRTLYILILTLVLGTATNGQNPIVGPLRTNPVLQLQQKQSVSVPAPIAQTRSLTLNCTDPNPGLYFDGDSALVNTGEQAVICPDLFQRDTAYCLNCDDFTFGQLDSIRNNCFYYTSNTGITLDRDTMLLSLCDSNNVCEEIAITFVIKRLGQTLTSDLTVLPELASEFICVTDLMLPGKIIDSRSLACHDSLVGTIDNSYPLNDCFTFQANRLAEADTVCIEFCDQYCVCDTVYFPIKIEGDTLDLPFADDFSYGGSQVRHKLWLDKTVFVNKTLASRPPSVGVATFDGLDATGSPYGGDFGFSDVLTSNYLNLQGKNDVILSFYLQSKGLGYPPSGGANFLLEFKNQEGEWIEIKEVVDTFRVSLEVSPPFLYYEYPIAEADYLYNGFQFRFRALSDRQGILDLWHLDYVRLEAGRSPGVQTVDDLAISTFTFPVLDRYTHMPIKQFLEDPAGETVSGFNILLFNHENIEQGVNDNILTVKKLGEQQKIIQSTIGVNAENGPSLQYLGISNMIGFRSELEMELSNVLSANEPVDLVSTLLIRTESQESENDLPFVLANDSTSTVTTLDNFYAYDDGTAELVITTSSAGYQLAVEYELNAADSLRAVQFHFPHFNNDRGVRFNLFVWGENLEDGPIYEQRFLEPLFTSQVFDTLQGYTTYAIKDDDGAVAPLALPAGKFHIGWQQISGNESPVEVGFDRNSHKAAQKQYYNRRAWQSLEELDVISGAVMIRPVFGARSIFSTSTKDLVEQNDFPKAFPNPSRDNLYFTLPQDRQYEDYEIRIVNTAGQVVFQGILNAQIELNDFGTGLYFLEFIQRESQVRHFQKIMVLK